MTEVGFYQLTGRAVEAVLPKLLEKAHAAGHRCLVRCRDDEQAEQLDERLWTYDERSFLPHGRTDDAAQPILLTVGEAPREGFGLLALASGPLPGDVSGWERILYLFDGNDETALAQARADWKAIKARSDVTPVYWRAGETGGWEKAG